MNAPLGRGLLRHFPRVEPAAACRIHRVRSNMRADALAAKCAARLMALTEQAAHLHFLQAAATEADNLGTTPEKWLRQKLRDLDAEVEATDAEHAHLQSPALLGGMTLAAAIADWATP